MTLSSRERIHAFKSEPKMGTFSGVFLPNILQMVGVLLFMRLGWILGCVGLPNMLIILTLSSSILFVTSLSISSIVSNMKVGSGGAYYIISRILGVEFGSAIGILLCLSQIASIAICVSGFAISIQEFFPYLSLTNIKILTLCGLVLISTISTSLAIKTQLIIFSLLIASVGSIFLGTGSTLADPLPKFETLSTASIPFWAGFALFFPAITGIEVGMAMSGDLKKPSRSLITGTVAAVVVTFLLYCSITLFLSTKISNDQLRTNPFIMAQISKYSFLILLGVWGSSISCALGSILGTPRVIQALAKDKVLPSFLAKGDRQPRVATLFVFMITTLLTIGANMNQIIPFLTMVCLVSYGLINCVAFFESFLQNPSWRPNFTMHWSIPLIGAIGCLIIMLMINAGATLIVLTLTTALCLWTASRHLSGNWDDIRHTIFSFLIYKGMSQLALVKPNAKSWRPHMLTLFDQNLPEKNLAYFSHALDQGKGFLTFGTCIESPSEQEETIRKTLHDYQIPSYVHINRSKESVKHLEQLIANYGLGPLKPNTIILPLPQEPSRIDFYGELVTAIPQYGKNLIFFKDDPSSTPLYTEHARKPKEIDLWWKGGNQRNFELCLALSYTMRGSPAWCGAEICIKSIVDHEETQKKLHHVFDRYQQRLRIRNFRFESILDPKGDFFENLLTHSADFTFLGLRDRQPEESLEDYKRYFAELIQKTSPLKNFALVLAGEDLAFEKIFN
ncbi:MAG: amino acid permease [Verrucomicrobia bacterium]|nr:amino acid permease [Verrucomicrobiota bacterium]